MLLLLPRRSQMLLAAMMLVGSPATAALLAGSPAAAPTARARRLLATAPTAMAAEETDQPAAITPFRVLVKHVMVETEEMARACLGELEKGAPFDEIAQAVSTCESAENGGELGWLGPGLMVPEFDKVAFNTPPGETRLAQTPFGWHVLRVDDTAHDAPVMEPQELQERLERGEGSETLQLVDVRGPEELEEAPEIPGAQMRHLQYNDWQTWIPQALDGSLGLRRDVETILVCHRGGRAERLMQHLAQNGFSRARFLRGGINAYAEEADPRVPVYLESEGDCNTCHEH